MNVNKGASYVIGIDDTPQAMGCQWLFIWQHMRSVTSQREEFGFPFGELIDPFPDSSAGTWMLLRLYHLRKRELLMRTTTQSSSRKVDPAVLLYFR